MNRRAFIGALAAVPVALQAAKSKPEPEAFRAAAEGYFGRPATLTRARLDTLTPSRLLYLCRFQA